MSYSRLFTVEVPIDLVRLVFDDILEVSGSIEPILQCPAEALGMCKTGDWEKPTGP